MEGAAQTISSILFLYCISISRHMERMAAADLSSLRWFKLNFLILSFFLIFRFFFRFCLSWLLEVLSKKTRSE